MLGVSVATAEMLYIYCCSAPERYHEPLPCRPAGDGEDALSFETSKGVKVVTNFESMGIREPLLRGIYAFGANSSSSAQSRVLRSPC